jgi:predicted DCC family thiol-disulfide oxidoreductase YuxK
VAINQNKSIILFDGVCNLCNASVIFIIKRDKKDIFRFATLQSDFGQKVCKRFSIDTVKEESVLLYQNDRLFTHSTASLKISKKLSGLWPIFYVLIIIPIFIRDFAYNLIARNRYKWFGKREKCMIPTTELKHKFIDS